MIEVDKNHAIEEILTRGVEDIFLKESLKTKLLSGKKMRIKLGFDPTSNNVHIGRAITLWKLRAFQDLGHQVVFIIGDFTALIGDPSDKLSKRPMLTEKDVKQNLKTYKAQIGKIIDLKKAEFHYNSKWLKKLNFAEIAHLAESFTVSQMLERRNFKERYEKGDQISVREFLYPLLQGYDSVMVKADVELGGFDQLFNVKAGRVIQKYYGQPEQDVMVSQMLEGTDGRKMSSSWGNVIAITSEPVKMYGQIMSMRDELIERYFTLCTRLSNDEIEDILSGLKSGINPRDIKMRLAREIVALYHGAIAAQKAETAFIDTFKNKKIPEDIIEISLILDEPLVDVLIKQNIVTSKTEWRRLIDEKAVSIVETEEKIINYMFRPVAGTVLRIGKKRFVKIT